MLKYTKNVESLRWGRLIVQAVSAGNSVLSDKDLDDLIERVEKLEEAKLNE